MRATNPRPLPSADARVHYSLPKEMLACLLVTIRYAKRNHERWVAVKWEKRNREETKSINKRGAVPCLCADRCHAWPAKDACMRVRESRWMLRGGNLCCHLCCESVWLGSAYYYLTGIGFPLLFFSFLVFFSDLESWAAWEEARPLKSSSTSCMACYQCPVLCHRLVTTGSPPFIE